MKNRWELINFLIEKYKYKNYLEIGIDNSRANFDKIVCNNKVGVDPKNGNPTYQTTSDKFFKEIANDIELFDIIFIDGLHHSDQVDKDIQNSLNRLSTNGCIVLHDCNPESKHIQTIPNPGGVWTGDVWKSIVRFRKINNEYGVVVLNMDYGCGVISSNLQVTQLNMDIPKEMTYEWLNTNRKELLNLIAPEKLNKYWRN